MVTATRDVATVQAALRLGAPHYLVKPFTFTALRSKLDEYAALRRELDSAPGDAAQDQVDRIFNARAVRQTDSATTPPKGHSTPTADLVHTVLREARGALSAQEVAERSGLSRQTARRCLKLLEGSGPVHKTLR